MFNNPFESFHDTVAQAKEEREQLDRLLTISTPRERLLVVGIALLLLVLAAWLFFGNVARSLAVDGVLVGPGDASPEGGRSVQALVWAGSDVAPRIGAGMPAQIALAGAGDVGTVRFGGAVASVTAVPAPGGLAELGSAPPMSLLRLVLALDETPDLASVAGRECRIVIEVGRQSPVALLGAGRP